jgi:hypothetical protein
MRPGAWHSMLLTLLLLLNLVRSPAWAQQPVTGLRIVVVEGEGAINNIKQRVNRSPVVRVEDVNGRTVAGAAVVFSLPGQGPSGTFPNGSRTLTTNTDAQGQASAVGIRPNNLSGQLQIRVTASFQGQAASAVITQTNAELAGSSKGLSGTAKVLIVLAIAGGAAAGGVVAATRGGSSSGGGGGGGGGGGTPTVITPGTPSVGGPR